METNFFQAIAALHVGGGWTINITNNPTGKWVISVLFYNDSVGDDVRKRLPPIILKGTPAELDGGFFEAVSQPVQETAALFTNMEDYLKQREEAKAASQMQKDKTAKADKDKTDKQKKYEEAMKKVDELEAEGKFKEAWMKVPSPQDYPEDAETLRARKAALSAQFAPDLFNEPKTV
ncbi:PRTRC system protein E [Flavobacterium sp. Sd200]|uniref:PRTRC system protein E n=1 Tax=Flavobacterium sp. Sd200 TaxID=2692211 RepID=UPI00137069FE|nr:PRTRC system protein E [Flavobacterium sp. Sd200]MXN91114.1 PRTRC system protein E [Flavobacterium sp. Sd200]